MILLSIPFLLGQSLLADIEGKNPGYNNSSTESHTDRLNNRMQFLLDENLEFEDDSTFVLEKPKAKSELQKLLIPEQESRFHLRGGIMLDDDASIKHPSLHDIDDFEIDITIDFE